jgi:cytochrome b561
VQNDLSIDQPSASRAIVRYGAAVPTLARVRRQPFDGVSIFLHWLTAVFVLGMFASAWLHSVAEVQASVYASALIQIHRSLGATVWVATGLRLAWRLTNATLPPFLTGMTKVHRAVVRWSEYVLYALLLVQPVTGLGATLFNGRSFALFFWRVPQLLSEDKAISAVFHSAHELGAWSLAALALGHATSALFHHLALRDDTLECMAPAIRASGRKADSALGRVIGGRFAKKTSERLGRNSFGE